MRNQNIIPQSDEFDDCMRNTNNNTVRCLNIIKKIKISQKKSPILDTIQNILSSCYIDKLKIIIFGVLLKDKHWNKSMDTLFAFNIESHKLVGKSIYDMNKNIIN